MRIKSITIGAICLIAAAFPVYRHILGVKPVVVDAAVQAEKIDGYYNPGAFITHTELNKLMTSDNPPVVIGALNPVYLNPAISGSFTTWRPDYSAKDGEYEFEGMRADQVSMGNMLGSFGATSESTIVVYAANDHHDAGRLFWQIKMLGHKDIRILDGGLNAWVGADLPTGNANPEVEPTDYHALAHNDGELASYDMVVNALNNPDWVIIDTRDENQNAGRETESGAFGPGTIPSSRLIEWKDALNKDTTLKTKAELESIYGEVIQGKKVIAFCQSGVRSAHTTLVLKEILGAEEVYNYDGSWIEWSHAYYEEKKAEAVIDCCDTQS